MGRALQISLGVALCAALGAGAVVWKRRHAAPPPEPVAVAPVEAPSAAPEAPDAGTPDGPDTLDINYWRDQVRKVAEQGEAAKRSGAPEATPSAGTPASEPSKREVHLAGGRPECEGKASAAWQHFSEGAVASAEAEVRAILAKDPDCASAHVVLGHIHYQRGDLKAALAEWEAAKRLAPKMGGLDALLAKARREQGVEDGLGQKDTSHFLVSFDGRDDREAARVAVDILEEARAVVGKALDYFPSDAVPVILYPGETFRQASGRPAWADGLYDGKIRLASSGAAKRPDEFRAVLYHEYTHALVHRMASGRPVPAWLNEGLAQYTETLVPGGRGQVRTVRANAWVPLTQLPDSFIRLDERSASLAYGEARVAVEELVRRYRVYRVRELLERLGRGKSFETAFEDTYVITYESFAKQAPGQ